MSAVKTSLKNNGREQFGIYQRNYPKFSDQRGHDFELFLTNIASHLNMELSDRIAFLVTLQESETEIFKNVSPDQKHYTIIVGCMPNTIVKIRQTTDNIRTDVEIEFNVGDLIILDDSVECMYHNSKYIDDKFLNVLYMFFDDVK